MCKKNGYVMKSRSKKKIFEWDNLGVVVAMFLSVVLMATGCRHTAAPSSAATNGKKISEWRQSNPVDNVAQTVSIDDLLTNPDAHLNKNIILSGVVDDLKLKKSSKGYRILALDLRGTPQSEEVPQPNTIDRVVELNLLEQLESIGEMLVTSTRDIELSSLEVTAFEGMSYDLKINGTRIRALSNFFRSKELFDIGKDVELIANGYLKLGDAVYSFSNLILESKPDLLVEQIDLRPELEINENNANSFQDAIRTACDGLSTMAEVLVENRYKIVNGEFVLISDDTSNSNGYSLLSIGDLFEAKRWESKKNDAKMSEHQFDILGKGYTLVGHGISDVYNGFTELGDKLTVKVEPTSKQIVDFPTLKCAYIGYNRYVLKDCESKVKQLGNDGMVTVRGRLIRGNLHEQMNLVWVKMESVTVDDLTINLAHNESSSTWRNLSSFYDWVKETTN